MKWIALAGVVAILLTSSQAATAASSPQVHALQSKVHRLQGQVRTTRLQRDEARAALTGGLAPQVQQLATFGSISQLAAAIFEPVKAAWPCGATIFQGQTFWSLDVELSDYNFETDSMKTCGG